MVHQHARNGQVTHMAERGFRDYSHYHHSFAANIHGPTPIFFGRVHDLLTDSFSAIDPSGHFAGLRLLTYSLSGLRSASMLIVGGASWHTPPILRASLESAAYGRLFESSEFWRKTWASRHSDKKSANALRSGKFNQALKTCLCSQGDHLLREYKSLYELLIDFGAHPNIWGVDSTIRTEPMSDGNVKVLFTQLGDETDRAFAFCMTTQVSAFLLNVMMSIWTGLDGQLDVSQRLLAILDEMFDYGSANGINDIPLGKL